MSDQPFPGKHTPAAFASPYPPGSTGDRVLALLAEITGIPEVRRDLDLRLYDQHILDSMTTVDLIVGLSDQFGLEISPTEFDREQWGTPRLIVASIEARLAR